MDKERLVGYLVGSGFRSEVPREDLWFYQLAGDCGHRDWPAHPREWKRDTSNEEEGRGGGGVGDNQPADSLFRAKRDLPAPIYRQTYRIWKSTMDMNLQFCCTGRRHTIYIQPLDDFPDFIWKFNFQDEKEAGFFTLLQRFLKVFFLGMDVKVLPAIRTDKWVVRKRQHKLTGQAQLLVDDLHLNLSAVKPKRAQAIIGITWTDLYPSEDLNFVLGQASVKYRSAVMCFGRFETKPYEMGLMSTPIESVDGGLIHKMIRVLVHETCHVFYLSHCVFYECLMNESTSIAEAVGQPLFLCPVCLRKLQKVCRFNIIQRYDSLLDTLKEIDRKYPDENLNRNIAWLEKLLQWARVQSAIVKA